MVFIIKGYFFKKSPTIATFNFIGADSTTVELLPSQSIKIENEPTDSTTESHETLEMMEPDVHKRI